MDHVPRKDGLVGLLILVAFAFGSAASSLHGQSKASPAENPIAGKFVQIPAPNATCATVSDLHGLVVVGQKGLAKYHLSAFQLDEKGALKGQPARTLLPRPASVKKFTNYPLGVFFHPKLPLLYVWQDIAGPKPDTPGGKAIFSAFHHLLIFRVEDGKLKSAGAFARGADFAYGQGWGLIATDPAGKRIFMPNMRDPRSGRPAIGYYDLDEKGMPKPVPVPIEGSLDGRGLNKFKMEIRPTRIDVGHFRNFPTGRGFLAPSAKVVVFSGVHGPAVWDTENRRASLGLVYVPGMPGDCMIAGHPKLPVVFGAGGDRDVAFRIEHADGYPTLLPQTTSVPDAKFQSAPVVMRGRENRLAIGGVGKVHVLPLDNEGRFTGPAINVAVNGGAVHAIAYSERFDRLYVAVEKVQ